MNDARPSLPFGLYIELITWSVGAQYTGVMSFAVAITIATFNVITSVISFWL